MGGKRRFILSKGHGTLGYYTALAEAGFISREELATFERNGGILPGQPVMNPDKGIEFSSGSLGHGLSLGVGVALPGKKRGRNYRVYVLMGDGECNEGSVWEAAMAAKHFQLDNLIAIIDANEMQSDGARCDIMSTDYAAMWQGFGWDVVFADGHNISSLYNALIAGTAPEYSPGDPCQYRKRKRGLVYGKQQRMAPQPVDQSPVRHCDQRNFIPVNHEPHQFTQRTLVVKARPAGQLWYNHAGPGKRDR